MVVNLHNSTNWNHKETIHMMLKGWVKFWFQQSQAHRSKPSTVTCTELHKPRQLGGDLLLGVKLRFSSKFMKSPLSWLIQSSNSNATFTLAYTSKKVHRQGRRQKHTERQENIARNFQIQPLTTRRDLGYLGPSRKTITSFLPVELERTSESSCISRVQMPASKHWTYKREADRCQKMKTSTRDLWNEVYQASRVAELNIHK